jgi:hypothetical protein
MSVGSVLEGVKDLYGIVLFFRDNCVDDDLYEALDRVLRMIEEFLMSSDVSEEKAKDFMNELYSFVRSNPLTKFLSIYIRDYVTA